MLLLLDLLTRQCNAVRKKLPELWSNSWLLITTILQSMMPLTIRLFLAKKRTAKLDHPSYLPDVAPWTFGFSQLKTVLKEY